MHSFVDEFVLPVTRKQRSGHIINISSVAGVVGLKHCAAYGAPKFAVEGLSLSVATEVEQFGIKITVVAPASSARTFWMSGTSGGPAMSWRTARLTATLQRRGRLIMASSRVIRRSWARVLVKIAGMENPPKQFLAWKRRPHGGCAGARGLAAGNARL